MNAALDHVFICCSAGAPEADALRALGLSEGTPNTHPGQGTACRRFFFANAYLELFWVDDADVARSANVAPTRLWERWSGRGATASPFGIILRPSDDSPDNRSPFDSWSYVPSYLPPGMTIEIVKDTPLLGPEIFFLGLPRAAGRGGARPQPRDHALGVKSLTRVTVWRPAAGDSTAAQLLQSAGLVSFRDSDEHLIDLEFDNGARGGTDLGPTLPLRLRW